MHERCIDIVHHQQVHALPRNSTRCNQCVFHGVHSTPTTLIDHITQGKSEKRPAWAAPLQMYAPNASRRAQPVFQVLLGDMCIAAQCRGDCDHSRPVQQPNCVVVLHADSGCVVDRENHIASLDSTLSRRHCPSVDSRRDPRERAAIVPARYGKAKRALFVALHRDLQQ
jgi:hypothetical protein